MTYPRRTPQDYYNDLLEFNYDADVGEHVPFTPYFNGNDPMQVPMNNGNANASAYAAMPESMLFQGGVPGAYPMSTQMQTPMQRNVQMPPPMMSSLDPWPAPAPVPQTHLPSPPRLRARFPPSPPPAYSTFGYEHGRPNPHFQEEVIDLTRSDTDGGIDKAGVTNPRRGRVQDENARLRAQRDAIRMRDEGRREAVRVRCENEWRGQEAERVKVKSERDRKRKDEDVEVRTTRQAPVDAAVRAATKKETTADLGKQWLEKANAEHEGNIRERAQRMGMDVETFANVMASADKDAEEAAERLKERARLKQQQQQREQKYKKDWENWKFTTKALRLKGINIPVPTDKMNRKKALKELKEEDVEGVGRALEKLSVGGEDVDTDMVDDSHQQEEDWEVLQRPDVGCVMVDECVDSDDSDTWC